MAEVNLDLNLGDLMSKLRAACSKMVATSHKRLFQCGRAELTCPESVVYTHWILKIWCEKRNVRIALIIFILVTCCYYNVLGILGFPKCIIKINFTFYVATRKFRII